VDFLSPSRAGSSELTEKRSRFLGRVFPVADEAQAREAVARVKSERRDARHNPWCWILPDGAERSSDDGEPSGTSGAPMLEMLRHENVRGAVCVVTRYFGGVLLGPGGLSRAYTAAAKSALTDSAPREFTAKTRVVTVCAYGDAPRIRSEIAPHGGVEESAEYGERVTLSALFDADNAAKFAAKIKELTAGDILPEVTGSKIVPV
jgi:uncharacterized YigZ family protein